MILFINRKSVYANNSVLRSEFHACNNSFHQFNFYLMMQHFFINTYMTVEFLAYQTWWIWCFLDWNIWNRSWIRRPTRNSR